MEERIYSNSVIVSLEGVDEKLYLQLSADGDITFSDSAEEVLKDVLSFMRSAFLKEGVKALHFDVSPSEYVINYGSFSIHRFPIDNPIIPSCAWFDLGGFKDGSLDDVAKFILDYFESDCSKGFERLAFFPIDPEAGTYSFSKDSVAAPLEVIKTALIAAKLSGFTH